MQHVAFSETVKLLMMKEQLVPIISILYTRVQTPLQQMVKPLQVFKGLTTFNVAGHPLHDFYRLDCLSECKFNLPGGGGHFSPPPPLVFSIYLENRCADRHQTFSTLPGAASAHGDQKFFQRL